MRLVGNLVTGAGWYHLYFLLVTMEFALVFPLLLRLLRRTVGRHSLVLGVSLVVQLATLMAYQRWQLPADGWRAIVGDASLPAYTFGGGMSGCWPTACWSSPRCHRPRPRCWPCTSRVYRTAARSTRVTRCSR
jgi:peptidoglycan/LPS O-acetylase OafA/YrhL